MYVYVCMYVCIYKHTFVKETVIQIPFLPQGNDEGDSYNENPGITFL